MWLSLHQPPHFKLDTKAKCNATTKREKRLKIWHKMFHSSKWFTSKPTFGWMHRLWVCLLVTLKLHSPAATHTHTHTHTLSFIHARTNELASHYNLPIFRTTSNKWCGNALTSRSRVTHRLYGLYVCKPWHTLLPVGLTPRSHGPIKKVAVAVVPCVLSATLKRVLPGTVSRGAAFRTLCNQIHGGMAIDTTIIS